MLPEVPKRIKRTDFCSVNGVRVVKLKLINNEISFKTISILSVLILNELGVKYLTLYAFSTEIKQVQENLSMPTQLKKLKNTE